MRNPTNSGYIGTVWANNIDRNGRLGGLAGDVVASKLAGRISALNALRRLRLGAKEDHWSLRRKRKTIEAAGKWKVARHSERGNCGEKRFSLSASGWLTRATASKKPLCFRALLWLDWRPQDPISATTDIVRLFRQLGRANTTNKAKRIKKLAKRSESGPHPPVTPPSVSSLCPQHERALAASCSGGATKAPSRFCARPGPAGSLHTHRIRFARASGTTFWSSAVDRDRRSTTEAQSGGQRAPRSTALCTP